MNNLTREQIENNNKALSNQLDKVTEDLFKAQEIASELKRQLDEKKATEQVSAWAIDRALEEKKLELSVDVLKRAGEYTAWIKASSATPPHLKEVA